MYSDSCRRDAGRPDVVMCSCEQKSEQNTPEVSIKSFSGEDGANILNKIVKCYAMIFRAVNFLLEWFTSHYTVEIDFQSCIMYLNQFL